MEKVKLSDICSPKQWKTIPTSDLLDEGYPVYGANGIIGYYSEYNHEHPVVVVTCRGATCGSINITVPKAYVTGNAMCLDNVRSDIDMNYLYYCLKHYDFNSIISGSAQPQITRQGMNKIYISICSNAEQIEIVDKLRKIEKIISLRKQELQSLDDLIKARFVELFGDLKSNNKGWQIVSFKECADIDTNMIHDFEGYEDYPHIGIDSIEKETGRLVGYRTIEEDGVISGKYLFTPAHIIYSKIRPNLNKVAMPNLKGLCSADAYPILVKEGICNREYFGYTLRSKYFLDYILAFSNRTNLPKVNKNQVEGFSLPLPPIELQNKFADFVKATDKSKVAVQKALDETQMLFDSLMQEYFG